MFEVVSWMCASVSTVYVYAYVMRGPLRGPRSRSARSALRRCCRRARGPYITVDPIWIPSKDRSNIQYAETHLSPFAVPAFVSRRKRNWPIAATLAIYALAR